MMTLCEKCAKHFWVVCKHKAIVFRECCKCGIPWRGITHDMSKFSIAEFVPSAKYFQGTSSPIEKEKEAKGYSEAWFHHKGNNRHHWEWWTDFDNNGNVVTTPIPLKYIIEMICDWIAAGLVYGGGKWHSGEPLNYYNTHKQHMHFHIYTEQWIEALLVILRDSDLDGFHEVCRALLYYHEPTDEDYIEGDGSTQARIMRYMEICWKSRTHRYSIK